jgi:endonuclease I
MKKILCVAAIVINVWNANAQAPSGYYNSAGNNTCAALKTALKSIITNGNIPQTYTALWTQYQLTDIKPRTIGTGSTNVIYDIYSAKPGSVDPYQFTPITNQCGTYNSEADCYNREHSVPISWFGSPSTSTPGTATDYLFIFPTDGHVNGKRANFIYGEVASASFISLNGSKLGSSSFAGLTGTVFEPIDSFKGDVARAFLYFVTRYQDDIPTWSSITEAAQAFDNNTFPSVKINYLKLMLKWHNLDPVSQKEKDRNNGAYSFQGNRNPFIDSPQYVNRIWNNLCPGLAALPVNIVSFSGKLISNKVILNWEVENEINVNRYEIERSFTGTDYSLITSIKAINNRNYSVTDFAENNKGKRVYYRIKKVDNDGRFSYSEIFTLHIPFNTKFNIYPNPASDFIHVQLNNNSNNLIAVEVSDLLGKIIIRSNYTSNNGVVDIATKSLPTGTFMVKLTSNGETYIQKFVVIK